MSLLAVESRHAGQAPLVDPSGQSVGGDFLVRWDIDGDGAVTPDEHGRFEALAARCDVNGDGRIDARDAAPEGARR